MCCPAGDEPFSNCPNRTSDDKECIDITIPPFFGYSICIIPLCMCFFGHNIWFYHTSSCLPIQPVPSAPPTTRRLNDPLSIAPHGPKMRVMHIRTQCLSLDAWTTIIMGSLSYLLLPDASSSSSSLSPSIALCLSSLSSSSFSSTSWASVDLLHGPDVIITGPPATTLNTRLALRTVLLSVFSGLIIVFIKKDSRSRHR